MTLTEVKPGHWSAVGELTFTTSGDAWQPLQACLSADGAGVQLDVAGLTRVDSAGLATLVAWLAIAKNRQIGVQIVGATEQLLQLARVGGVDTVLPLQWQTATAATA